MKIASTAFADNGEIPAEHTCEGRDTAPPLQFSGVPPGARSLALIVDDPDAPDPAAPKMTWVHWVVYDLVPTTAGLPAGGALPAGAHDGLNDWKRIGYGGPCPPVGRHRYFFKLYALDSALSFAHPPTKQHLEQAMKGHVLAHAELVGTYARRGARG
jgi:Raf kinase inhibitor-like YbhB/YbcL family protein